ncbi:efflux RND transporter periplasmic adaptor subunit [Cupriavidus malaysiensis]|uniref:Efflux transporter periplasmic adaptor subunit n=1 Tax=Cupriavidus malaysiensis TaxID=367825 RepID=A0ABM6F3R9_9BURK|nr:efflux RND transporter periplasmic adaptor subunit [Cupriavidus malaysiensis]AOZ05987.1 efflux transporter periplasmic adaptor subunit [Cupriavidus malaysiensis]
MPYPDLRRRRLLALATACTAPWLLAACEPSGPAQAKTAEPPSRSATDKILEGSQIALPPGSPLRGRLVVDTVRTQEIARQIPVPGVIEADPARLVRIAPPLPGRILQLHAGLGDAVRQGEPLVTLDSAELSSAQAEAGKARAALQETRLELERQRTLYAEEIAARKDLEQAELAHAQASHEAEATAARLAQLGASSGNDPRARRQLVIRAPISGRVIALDGAPGGYWNDTNAPLMTVADLSTVYLAANVPEKDIAAVFVGQRARIDLNAYPGEPASGEVRYVGETLDADTRTVKVRVAMANRDGRLRPGMFARVTFSGRSRQTLVVPVSALLQDGLYTKVMVEHGEFRYAARTVRTGDVVDGMAEVLDGLRAGERVVVKNGVLLND